MTGRRLAGRAAVRLAVGVVALATASAALAMRAAVADAHAVLLGSEPADGQTVPTAPAEVRLRFDEAVASTAAQVELRNGHGVVVADTRATAGTGQAPGRLTLGFVLGAVAARRPAPTAAPAAAGTDLHIALPVLPDDVYELRWRLVSADDFHATSGAIAFGVGRRAVAAGSTAPEPWPSPLAVAARWLDLLAMTMLAGAVALWLWLVPVALVRSGRRVSVPRDLVGRTVRRSTGVALTAAAVGVGAHILLLAASIWVPTRSAGLSRAAHAFAHQLARPRPVLFIGLDLLVVAVLWRARRSALNGGTDPLGSTGRAATAVAAASVALLGIAAQDTHVTTVPAGARLAGIVLTYHLVAAGIWVGGLAALVIAVVPLLRDRALEARTFGVEILRSFGAPATAGVVVVGLTGLALTGRQAASVDALLRSAYGHVLGIKLVLALAAGALGLWTHRRLRHADVPVRVGRALVVEAVVTFAVLALAAVLAEAPPALGARYGASARPAAQVAVSGPASDLFVTATVTPNQPGAAAFLDVDVLDTRRPAPAPVAGVTVTWVEPGAAGSQTFAATQVDRNRWQVAGLTVARSGDAHLEVRIARHGLADVQFAHGWVVPPAPVVLLPTVVSRRPLAPVVDVIALVGAVLALVVVLVRRRRFLTELARRADTGLSITNPIARSRSLEDAR